jgi:NADH dehydrogenase
MARLLEEIHRRRLLLPIPFGLASLAAMFLQFLPVPLLTPDQVRLLKRDNVAGAGVAGLGALGLTPTALELILPTYVDRFRRPDQLRIA